MESNVFFSELNVLNLSSKELAIPISNNWATIMTFVTEMLLHLLAHF